MTADYLRTCVEYDPNTGLFVWRWRDDVPNTWNGRFAGKPAFTFVNRHGYCEGVILYQKVRAHRAAWALVYDAAAVALHGEFANPNFPTKERIAS